ncbi:MAG TPA: aldo/keto reductase, partial [Ilumatobacteraceae bacterium]|nr:aldo/keto reductase [Ilumatobacteraceae bacterium]
MDEQLDRVPLGRTGLTVTRLGLGTAPLATIFWGNDEARGVATAARAVERGIRLFDSAPLYGLGESETRLGRALATVARDDVVVATKAGRSLVSLPGGDMDAVFDFSRDATLRQLETSLERLGLDRIDIVHIHDPEDHLAEAIDGTYAALDRLRHEGVIGAVSLGTNVVATASFFLRNADLDTVMVAGRLTLLDQSAAVDLVPECRRAGVAYLAAGVFNSGVLAEPRPGSWFDYAPASSELLERAAAIRAVCESHGVSMRTAALHYPLTVEGVTALIVGMRSPTEVDDNLA